MMPVKLLSELIIYDGHFMQLKLVAQRSLQDSYRCYSSHSGITADLSINLSYPLNPQLFNNVQVLKMHKPEN